MAGFVLIGKQRILAVIPARGGSKGIPGKNIKPLGGKPLVAHAILLAQQCKLFDQIIVSTDDLNISAVANRYGCQVIERPWEISTDQSKTEAAVIHALSILEQQGGAPFDYAAILEPTSPLRTKASVVEGCKLIAERGAHSLLSVSECTNVVGTVADGIFEPFVKIQPRRRQERESVYAESGVIYVVSTDYLHRTGSLVSQNWLAHVIPKEEALDINTLEDFNLAERILAEKSKTS